MASPKVTAYNFHEWVFSTLLIPENDLSVLQIDGPRRKVCLKFATAYKMNEHLSQLQGEHEYKHDTDEVLIFTVSAVGLRHRTVRVASLPPEIQDQTLSVCLSQYGIVKETRGEKWSPQYRYKISSGVRLVNIDLKKHIPSQLYISGNRAIITYDAQPVTCFNCSEIDHQSGTCPYKRSENPRSTQHNPGTWSAIVQNRHTIKQGSEKTEIGTQQSQSAT
jgi:hypothetical protein